MWHIGDVAVDGRAVLGPMSGFTSTGYRDFMRPFGASLCFTEMVSDEGVIHGQSRTMGYLKFGGPGPTGVQLFGHDPESFSDAAVDALGYNQDIDIFDINMGCPVPKVNRSGAGSALMKSPRRCGDIVKALKRKVDVPITAKIRLGWDISSINFREVIDELVSAGADAITVHSRTRAERYAGSPHHDLIAGLQKEMSVPLIVSGNIYSLDDAKRASDMTGASAVMVARGGVGNPFLLTQIDRYFRTGERLRNPLVHQQVGWCLELADLLIEEKGEEEAVLKMRCFAPRFIAGCPNSRRWRFELATGVRDIRSLTDTLDEIDSEMGDQRIFEGGVESGPSDTRS